jgi:hypothetical protein
LDVDKLIQGIVVRSKKEAQVIEAKTKSARMPPRPEKIEKNLVCDYTTALIPADSL